MFETQGQEAPAVDTQSDAALTQEAEPTTPSTESGEVEKESQVEKTYSKQELQEALEKATAKAAAKAERRAERVYKEALAAAGLSRQAEAPQQETMPKREQYANDEDWLNARDEFRDRQRDAKVAQERGRESAAKQAQRVSTLLSEAEKLDGFDRDTFDSLPVSQAMADAILDSDIGSKLIAHLTLNEGEAERISKLSPARQAAEIGKLEAKLSTVKASNTPPPIKPIGSAGSSSKPVEQMSQSEYEAMRAKQGARWAR